MSDPQNPPISAPSTDAQPAPRPTNLRPFAIGFFVLGVLVLVGGIAKFVPGGIGTGAALCFFGVLLFALSFIPLPQLPDSEPPMSFISRLTGVFFEPTRVFRNIRIHPAWVAPFAMIVVLSAVYTFCFTQRVTPERIVNHTIDKLAEIGPPFAPPPDRLEEMRAKQIEDAKNPIQRASNVAKTMVGIFAFTALLGALYLLGILAFGGKINYWQSLAVVLHAGLPVIAIQKVLSLVLLYVKSPDDIHPILGAETLVQDNLGILFSPAEHPVLFVLASAFRLLSFYAPSVKAVGLKNGATKVSKGTAWGVAIMFWILGTLAITAITALFPNFIS